jgi:peptidoglycan/LPS O-acetylase OafA/YrhL
MRDENCIKIIQNRNGAIDALKIIGGVLIVFLHYQGLTGAHFSGFNFAHGTLFFGYIVELFYILSGIVCTKMQHKIYQGTIHFKDFLTNKFSRLLPMVIVSAIPYFIVTIIYYDVGVKRASN